MKRLSIIFYGLACYAVFFATFLYAIGWVGNLPRPVTVDAAPLAPAGIALLVNLGLLTLFAVQHSVMVRPAASSRPRVYPRRKPALAGFLRVSKNGI